jgi:glutathione S-transferase
MTMLRIWGRANSVNVQKVLWCCAELNLPFERKDAGLQYGVVDTPEYRAMNPNGRVPVLQDGDFVLWESNAILRYLALREAARAPAGFYPEGAQARASMERWLDWVLATLQPAERPFFWGMVRTPEAERDMPAITAAGRATGQAWQVVEGHLADGRRFIEGGTFTLADIVLGSYARRWFAIPLEGKPELPRVRAWFDGLAQRPAYQAYLSGPLS